MTRCYFSYYLWLLACNDNMELEATTFDNKHVTTVMSLDIHAVKEPKSKTSINVTPTI